MALPMAPNAKIRPRDDTLYVTQGRSVLATQRNGFICDGPDHGFLCFETRFLSRYEMFINGIRPHPNVLSNIDQHTWLGYYTFLDESILENPMRDEGSGQMSEESERTLEMKVARYVGDGIHEDIDFTNFTGKTLLFELSILADSDFSDQMETSRERKQTGALDKRWEGGVERWSLNWRYSAENEYAHQDVMGHAKIQLGFHLDFHECTTEPSFDGTFVRFRVELKPHERWHTCVDMVPEINGHMLNARYKCHSFHQVKNEYDSLRATYLRESASFEDPSMTSLAPVVIGALNQAKLDLASMRLYDLDTGRRAWTVAAGLPIYTAFFGRDTLSTSWQAGLLGPEIMKGTLPVIARHQGKQVVNWFDEEPGRMLHEMHTGPLAELRYNNLGHNYGSVTTTHLYPFMVSQLWHWTGNKKLVERYLEPALKALQWMSKYGDLDGDGLLEYKTRSINGVRNQGWKDSENAIVYEDGREAYPPIAMSEEQAFAYLSKFFFAETLWSLGLRDEARKVFRGASELKKRFNEAFWMEDEGYYAMALDKDKNQIRSIGSDPGHCLTAGLADKSLVPRVADRMFKQDLFSGWGIRTLSSEHPSFNPYSYHRGSIWPVENGTFTVGFARYGLWGHLEKLARAIFEAAAVFDFNRLPELFSGHQRDADHPIPALYPKANSPQAWSSSAVINIMQALLGIYPYAPLKTLIVNPVLPEWLPQIQVNGIRVGDASITMRFYRKANGKSDYEILEQNGDLRVLHQSSPWSLTTGIGERITDLVDALWH